MLLTPSVLVRHKSGEFEGVLGPAAGGGLAGHPAGIGVAKLCALPGTGPSHGYIGQGPEICREASESIVKHARVPLARDMRVKHRDQRHSLDVSVLPAPSRGGRGQPDPPEHRSWEGNPRLPAAPASRPGSEPQTSSWPAVGACRGGGQNMGQSSPSPPHFGDERCTGGAPQPGTGCPQTCHPTAVSTARTPLGSRNSLAPSPLGTTGSFTLRRQGTALTTARLLTAPRYNQISGASPLGSPQARQAACKPPQSAHQLDPQAPGPQTAGWSPPEPEIPERSRADVGKPVSAPSKVGHT